jgi:hypothetical protein
MNKIFEKLLEEFKRANLAARKKMAARYGFKSTDEYEAYLKQPLVKIASTKVKRKSKVVSPLTEALKESVEEIGTDMVIAFDTTGSMSAYIGAVRNHVTETIGALFENTPDLKLKIVAFGDYCDMPSPKVFGKAYQQTELTSDKDVLIKFVKTAQNTSGGDEDEFYELVLKKILDETAWRKDSNKAILLIGDCDPHEVGYTHNPTVTNAQIDWRVEAKKAASMTIKIDTLRIHSHIEWYSELSKVTNGTCMNFKSAEKTQNIVAASTYLNSKSHKGIGATKVLYRSAMASGDTELSGAYKGMAADRGINLDEE